MSRRGKPEQLEDLDVEDTQANEVKGGFSPEVNDEVIVSLSHGPVDPPAVTLKGGKNTSPG